ncbi:hypothetical protein [Celeribacter ethanolicus]|uniref:hypothetical protein n=1 Tax=Celeribacter ethanolicus TaxID=1758178 RepID=UPI0012FDEE4B|nr:hypothetical protein [Celeribacter ethanolicus]
MGLFDRCKPDFSIICIWPRYPIDIGWGPEKLGLQPKIGAEEHPDFGIDNEGHYNIPLGHAGIVLVQGGTGQTRYYEYGRYSRDSEGNHIGSVRNVSVPNLSLEESGWPTVSSLHNLAKSITGRSGKNTHLHGNFDHNCGGYDQAVDFAESYNNSEYSFTSNSCITFAHKVNAAGGFSWFGPVPIWDSFPPNEQDMMPWQNYITYWPTTDTFKEFVWQISE